MGAIDYSNVCLTCDPSYGCDQDCLWIEPNPMAPKVLSCTKCDNELHIVDENPGITFGRCVEKKC